MVTQSSRSANASIGVHSFMFNIKTTTLVFLAVAMGAITGLAFTVKEFVGTDDPTRRLHSNYRVFTDGVAQTLYICAQSKIRPGETMFGNATIAGIDDKQPKHDLLQLVDLLHARGCSRLFVEGGGVTVSAFLEVDLLDRLHIAIAPLLIGDGRPAIRMSPHASLRDCLRPGYRVFRMGGDVLFDCELKVSVAGSDKKSSLSSIPPVTRII